MRNWLLGLAALAILAAGGYARADETEVSIDGGKGGLLYGSLVTPDKPAGKAPDRPLVGAAVLMLPGASPENRDGDVPPAHVSGALKAIAKALAEDRIVSLRIDPRRVGKSAKAGPATEDELRFDDLIDDAVAWTRFLAKQPGVRCVVILGRGESSVVAAAAAEKTPTCGVISLAGVGRPLPDVLADQLRDRKVSIETLAQVDMVWGELKAGRKVPNISATSVFRPSIQPFFMSELKYDPAATFAALKAPLLIVQGSADAVTTLDDAYALDKAHPRSRLVILNNVSHVMRVVAGPDSPPSDNNPDYPLAPKLMPAIVRFVEAAGR
jgi:pimeloyl-ACP methyl ester carboxylesterase